MKRCPGCHTDLPVSAFHRSSYNADGCVSRCKTCRYLDSAASRYGLTRAEVHMLQAQQGGRCAICRRLPTVRRLVIDHCHDTGEVRGLLCDPCNLGIGNLGDNELLLRRAADYLRRHAPLPDDPRLG